MQASLHCRLTPFLFACLVLLSPATTLAAAQPEAVPPASSAPAAQEEPAFDLSQVDDYPRRLTPENPRYPERLKREGVEAELQVLFIIEADGTVSNLVLHKSSDPRFDAVTRECVQRWRYEPARRAGKPVRVKVRVPVYFKLEE